MIKYSNGQIFNKIIGKRRKFSNIQSSFSHGNRGMDLENDINLSNEYYKRNHLCLITKRPTPINVVKVDYSKGAIITNAYFEKQSTTDYNGVYCGRYIDFEAKSTMKTTSFPLSNISKHQIEHLKNVLLHVFRMAGRSSRQQGEYTLARRRNNVHRLRPYSLHDLFQQAGRLQEGRNDESGEQIYDSRQSRNVLHCTISHRHSFIVYLKPRYLAPNFVKTLLPVQLHTI